MRAQRRHLEITTIIVDNSVILVDILNFNGDGEFSEKEMKFAPSSATLESWLHFPLAPSAQTRTVASCEAETTKGVAAEGWTTTAETRFAWPFNVATTVDVAAGKEIIIILKISLH